MHPLATIDRIEPQVVEPGDVIRVFGSGFIEGPVTVELSGTLKPMGLLDSRNCGLSLAGVATSANTVEISVTSQLMKRLTEEQSRFEGTLRVLFPTTPAGVRIAARTTDVTMDLRPTGGGVLATAKRERETRRFMRRLGIELSDSRNGGDGLVIAEVTKGSAADKAGLRFGDRLLAVDGVAIAKPSDMAGAQVRESHLFEIVSRSGTIREVPIGVRLGTGPDVDEFTAIILSSVALGLFLAFAAPSRRRLKAPSHQPTNPFAQAVGFAAVSVPLLLIPALAIVSGAGLAFTVFLLGASALALVACALLMNGEPVRRIFRVLLHFSPMGAIMAVAFVSSSAIGLDEIVAIQQTTPWELHVWSSPFAPISACAALSLIWPAHVESRQKRGGFLIVWAAAIPAASLLVCCYLGGWLIPLCPSAFIAKKSSLLAACCVIFLAKTWLVLLAARWLSSIGVEKRRAAEKPHRAWPRLVLLLLSTGAAIGWLWVDLPETARAAGQVLAAAASVTFFTYLAVMGVKSALSAAAGHGELAVNDRADSRSLPAAVRQ